MARYLVKETSFINNRLVQPGDVIEFELPKPPKGGKESVLSDNLELVKGSEPKDAAVA